ncbi:MAG: hypothetical protein C0467_17515 [Planctomycetaceae bacterium]|nr:hypothetical protein [Planctomycetaceae bacterium]
MGPTGIGRRRAAEHLNMSEPPTERSEPTPSGVLTHLHDWLRQNPKADSHHVIEVFRQDQQNRWRAGERVFVEAYLKLLSEAGQEGIGDEHIIELIYAEFLLRCELGNKPEEGEYFTRFPSQAKPLRCLFDLKHNLEAAILTRPTVANGVSTREGIGADSSRFDLSHSTPVVTGYEIESELGRGGMGVVYKAREVNLNRTVALKLIQSAEWDLRARFRVEAEAVARVQHPNIVQIFEVGDAEDGRPYMALEFVAGGSLAERLRGTRLSATESAALVETLARAVHFAHLRGILHRDLKPANILLSISGRSETGSDEGRLTRTLARSSTTSVIAPKVTDFGLAKRLDEADDGQTRTGAILGTPAYMAPEQAAGQNRDVGVPTDVHALGTILYECLTGQTPFRGRTAMDTLELVRHADPMPPRRIARDTPLDLETICLKCLQKEPAKRYSSAEALAEDLRRFLNREPILARRVGPVGRLTRWCRRNPALASTFSVALIALTLVAGVGLYQVVQERQRFRTERDQAQTNLYRALIGEARAQMKARETGWWWRAMENIQDAASLNVQAREPISLRELAIECMSSEYPCFRRTSECNGHTGPVTAIVCRADGKVAASAGEDATVRLWSVPDGKALAVLRGHSQSVTGVAFSSAGRLASCSKDGTVRIWNSTSPQTAPRTFTIPGRAFLAVDFSPDGQWLAAGCNDGTIRIFSASDLEVDSPLGGLPSGTKTLVGHSGPVICLTFSREGKLASGSTDLTIRFWDVVAAKQTHFWPVPNIPTSLEFERSAEVGLLAWGDEAGRTFEVRAIHSDGIVRVVPPLAGGVTQVRNIAGRWLSASRDGAIRLWRQISNVRLEELAVADPEFGPVHALAVVSNGAGVIAGHRDGRICFWELAEPRERTWINSASHNSIFTGAGANLIDSRGITDLSNREEIRFRGYAPLPVRALAIRPGERTFALGRDDGNMEVHDLLNGREVVRWKGHERSVTSLAASPDGQQLASASLDGTVHTWNWQGKEPLRTLQPRIGSLHSVAWNREGTHLAAAGDQGVVLWDLAHPTEPRRLSEAPTPKGSVTFGSGVVAFSIADSVIEVRSMPTGELRHTLKGQTATTVLQFSCDGTKLASGAADGVVRLWDMADGRELVKMTGARGSPRCLTFSHDDRYLVHGTSLFDVRALTEVALCYGTPGLLATAATPDGTLLFATRSGAVTALTLAEVDEVRGRAVGVNKAPLAGPVRVDVKAAIVPGGHTDGIWGIAASPNGRWIATASHDQTVKIWDATTLQLLRTLEGHGSVVWSVAFSPDSHTLASGSGDIRIWDVESGRQLHCFRGHERLVVGLAFHPRHPWLVSSSYDGSVRLWDVAGGRPLGLLHQFDLKANFDPRVHNVAFRPDGRWLAATADSRVALWEMGDSPPSGRPPDRLLEGHNSAVWSVGFSPDGQYLASGAEQGVVILWSGVTFRQVVTLRAGKGQIRGVSFNSNSERLAAASYYAPTIVWNLDILRRSLRGMNLDW